MSPPTPSFISAGIHILTLAHRILGLRTSFIARTTNDRFLALAVQNNGGCNLAEGREFPLQETYCSRTVQSNQPVFIPDVRHDPEFAYLPATAELGIGSYIGVPIYLPNGAIYGTLCAIDPEPAAFEPEQVEQMTLLAQLLSFFLRQDQRSGMHS